MANKDIEVTIIILFSKAVKGKASKNYRMRVARVHVHPGERDRIEVEEQDMLGGTSWVEVPDGSPKVPSGEWLVRRALWRVTGGVYMANDFLMTVDLGEI